MVAAEDAKLSQPEVNYNIIPGAEGTQRLPRMVGVGRAKELIFTGDIINAQEAFQISFVNCIVPFDKLFVLLKKQLIRRWNYPLPKDSNGK